jgi:hypothetical protein
MHTARVSECPRRFAPRRFYTRGAFEKRTPMRYFRANRPSFWNQRRGNAHRLSVR